MIVSSDGTLWRWDGYVDEKKERNKIINYSSRIEKLKKDSKIYDKELIGGLSEIKKLKLKCEQNEKDELKYKSEIENVTGILKDSQIDLKKPTIWKKFTSLKN